MTKAAAAELASALGAFVLGAGGLLLFGLFTFSDGASDRIAVVLFIGGFALVMAVALLGAFLHSARGRSVGLRLLVAAFFVLEVGVFVTLITIGVLLLPAALLLFVSAGIGFWRSGRPA